MASIRPAEPADARAIAELHVASWRWAYAGDLPRDVLDAISVDDREQLWNEAIPDPGVSVVVADENGRIVGFASTGTTNDADVSDLTGELFAIYLDADAAGKGVGSALLERAERDLRDAGFDHATLWVLESNARARRFYERAGWAWDGTTSHHRFDCANRLIMRYVREL